MLKAKTMRRLGFTDRVAENWYLCKRVGSGTTLNIRINKETWAIETDVLNEYFLQPEYYGHMKEPYRSAMKWTIDVVLAELKAKGLEIPFDHSEYGYFEHKEG